MVLDNSVAMRWCFGDGKRADLAYAEKALDVLAMDSARVPAIWALEVANVLSRAERQGLIDAAHSASFLTMLQKLRIVTDAVGTQHALTDTLHLARQHLLSAYDAAYLELALREVLPLATLEAGLRKAAKRAGVRLFM